MKNAPLLTILLLAILGTASFPASAEGATNAVTIQDSEARAPRLLDSDNPPPDPLLTLSPTSLFPLPASLLLVLVLLVGLPSIALAWILLSPVDGDGLLTPLVRLQHALAPAYRSLLAWWDANRLGFGFGPLRQLHAGVWLSVAMTLLVVSNGLGFDHSVKGEGVSNDRHHRL